MAMDQAIRDFPQQFAFKPVVESKDALQKKQRFVVCGMGGSNLASGLLQIARPDVDLRTHRDYGLPQLPEDAYKEYLFIAASYSGKTEETLASYDEARERGLALAAFAVGGKLLDKAKADGVPYIQLPNTGIQPRAALGFSAVALMMLMGQTDALAKLSELATRLNVSALEDQGKQLAITLQGRVPIFYASQKNVELARIAKIKMNETGKVPSFYNAFPELNHNEMTGFDATSATKNLCEPFHFIFLRDSGDHPQIQKRMDVVKKLYEDRGLGVSEVTLDHALQPFEKIFRALMVLDWASFYVGANLGVETEQVPMVEEFKRMIS